MYKLNNYQDTFARHFAMQFGEFATDEELFRFIKRNT